MLVVTVRSCCSLSWQSTLQFSKLPCVSSSTSHVLLSCRQAWVGGSLVHHPLSHHTDTASDRPAAPSSTQSSLRHETPPPRPRTAGGLHPPSSLSVSPAHRQATPERKSPSRLVTQAEDLRQHAQLATAGLVSGAQSAATSLDPNSKPTAVAVTVAVEDRPASSGVAKTGNIAEQQMPTLLPSSSSAQKPAAHTSLPLVPSVLGALSHAQDRKQQPHVDEHSPWAQAQLQGQTHGQTSEHQTQPQSAHQAAANDPKGDPAVQNHPSPPTQQPAGHIADATQHTSSAAGASPSGQHAEQPFSLASAMAERFQHPPGAEAERYSLHSAIAKVFGALPDRSSQSTTPQLLPEERLRDATDAQAAGPSKQASATDPGKQAVPATASQDQSELKPDPAQEHSLVDQLIRNRFQSLSRGGTTAEPAVSENDAAGAAADSQVCNPPAFSSPGIHHLIA